ncbi:2-polyprenyl-6-methoxyphenol hydroxylase-like FAD-dependent oxidoreductase [Dongia mobilis]|uniref:2-polyprenyl-6-methoxyphenol hydroxylase-like FAD-dependent oxidoreductase n=1 Tax=Dongia mobilis TaxID=578943 RepID=A0A4R6WFE4_9PROT|nr:flavin-dependent oxidoreductase [Dongia mobilis]TDQ78566.1 2-polyprenyl-6-methoxyphenol hydroxylase-like FAD-dependent oxidoreductase [Dongia mobilis]
MTTPPHVLIVGGGIGGLVTALMLQGRGIAVSVFEASREIRPLGVGINLLPHAVAELAALGLLDALGAEAIETAELAYFNKWGQEIWREPRGRAAGYDVPQFSIHRGALQMILYDAARAALGDEHLRTGMALTGFSQNDQGVVAVFADRNAGDGELRVHGDALIGADGIHSTVRRFFFPDEGPPQFSGRMLWRAVSRTVPFLGGRTMIMAGHQSQKFVCYPISRAALDAGQSLTNWIAELAVPGTTPPRSDWNRVVPPSVFAAPFQNWRFSWLDIPAIIAGAEAVYEFPMVDRDPLPRWSHGRVTLLGDAAHPMYPIGSNGASQAILDARHLADCLAAGSPISAALAAYEAVRLPATAGIVRLNRQNGPEQVMQLAEERAPNGFAAIDDVIPRDEMEEIARRYKLAAGFAVDQVRRG